MFSNIEKFLFSIKHHTLLWLIISVGFVFLSFFSVGIADFFDLTALKNRLLFSSWAIFITLCFLWWLWFMFVFLKFIGVINHTIQNLDLVKESLYEIREIIKNNFRNDS